MWLLQQGDQPPDFASSNTCNTTRYRNYEFHTQCISHLAFEKQIAPINCPTCVVGVEGWRYPVGDDATARGNYDWYVNYYVNKPASVVRRYQNATPPHPNNSEECNFDLEDPISNDSTSDDDN